MMFVASFLTFMTIGGFPSFVEDMKVCFVYHLSIINFMHIYFTSLFSGKVKNKKLLYMMICLWSLREFCTCVHQLYAYSILN
jgi:hypothetical protein